MAKLITSSKLKSRLPVILLFAFCAFLLVQLINGDISGVRGGDGASYVLLAKSIATGHGFADINIPGAPPHTQYPPLLPFIFSPFFYLFGYNFTWMQVVVIGFAFATVWMIKAYFEEEAGRTGALMIALLTATNFFFLFFSRELMTEIPYAFFALLALYLLRKYERGGYAERGLLAVCAAFSAAYMMRMIGVTLYGGASVALLYRAWRGSGVQRKSEARRFVLFSVFAVLPFALWTIRGALYSRGVSTYESIFMRADYYSKDAGGLGAYALFARFVKNSVYYYEGVSRTLFSSAGLKGATEGLVLEGLLFVIFIVFLAGFIHELRSKKGAREFYVLFYFGLLTVWPVYGSGDARRYIVPMLPFIYFYFLTGVKTLSSLKDAAARLAPLTSVPVIVAALFLLTVNLIDIKGLILYGSVGRFASEAVSLPAQLATRKPELSRESLGNYSLTAPCYDNYIDTAFELKPVLRPGEVIMTRKPEIISLITGGYAVRFPFTKKDGAVLDFIERNKVRYVLLDGCYAEGLKYVVPVIRANEGRFTMLLKKSDGTALLSVKRN